MLIFQHIFQNLYDFLVSGLPEDFFNNQFISYSLRFFQWFGSIVFAFGFLLLISTAVENHAAGEFVNLKMLTYNVFVGLLLLVFPKPFVIWSFSLSRTISINLIHYFVKSVDLPKLPEGLSLFGAALQGMGNSTLITLIMFVVTIVVFFQMLTLYGMFYIQIVTGYFNIASAMKGDMTAVTDWLRDIVASCLTFCIEYIFYTGGFAIMDYNMFDMVKCAPGLVLIVASPAVPSALRKWGYSHGSGSARGVAASLGNAVTGTFSALTHI